MKILVTLILLFHLPFMGSAHDYYFAFAEVEFNQMTNRFEGTIIFTTHDLEKSIQKDYPQFPIMDTMTLANPEFEILKKSILDGFFIQVNGQKENIQLEILGVENFLTGTTNVYFESDRIESLGSVKFGFKLLMSDYDGQQNKIAFKYGDLKETLYFMNRENEQTLNFNIESK